MDAQLKRGFIEICALAAVNRRDSYGYQIIEDMKECMEISESTLYPVLRRLQKDECLEVYDQDCAGRNRRYYKITERGSAQLSLYENEWKRYSEKITSMFKGGTVNE